MRISDWSSDVCSSDLRHPDRAAEIEGEHLAGLIAAELHGDQRGQHRFAGAGRSDDQGMADGADLQRGAERSEERRGGEACVRTGRSRLSPGHTIKQYITSA